MTERALYCLVMTTTDSQALAETLAQKIVSARLAACVQLQPVTSFYVWQGQSRRDAEYLLLIKTRQALYAALESFIQTHHNYATPEILQLPLTGGSPAYLQWLQAQTMDPAVDKAGDEATDQA